MKAAAAEFERFNMNNEVCGTSLRFDLHLAESSVSHLRLDLDMNSETKRPMSWKLTGPRHRAAELNTFVVQTQISPISISDHSGLAWQINLTFAKHIDAARDPMFEQFINRIRLEYAEVY